MSTDVQVQIATELAATLDAAGINYAFVHGLERFPLRIGRDLDLLVCHEQIPDAIAHAERHFRQSHWRFVAYRRLNGSSWCFVAPPSGHIVFEFDLIPRLRWGPAILVDRPSPISGAGPFKLDPWAGFVKRVLIQLLGGNIAKLAKAPHELALSDTERFHVQRTLPRYLSQHLAASLLRAVGQRDIEQLRLLIPPLRRSVVMRSLVTRPSSVFAATTDWIRNELSISPIAKSIIPVLAIVGVDGVGKSTLVQQLDAELRERLPVIDVQTRHWRPSLLPRLRRLIRRQKPEDESAPAPPRRSPGRGRTLRLAYYGLDFCIGGWWRDRRAAAQLKAVIYDRCILDMLVDPLRFGLKSSFGVSLIKQLAPGPDLVILLHDSPARIRARKGELHISEIRQQQSAWLALAAKGEVHVVLAVQQSSEALARRVVDHVIDRLFGETVPHSAGMVVSCGESPYEDVCIQ